MSQAKLVPLTLAQMETLVTICALAPETREAIAAKLTSAGCLVDDPMSLDAAIGADLAGSGQSAAEQSVTEQSVTEQSVTEQSAVTPITTTVRGRSVTYTPDPNLAVYTWTARASSKYGVRMGTVVGEDRTYVMRAYSETTGRPQGGAFVLSTPQGFRRLRAISEPIVPPSKAAREKASALTMQPPKANDRTLARTSSNMLAEGRIAGASIADQLAAHGYKPAEGDPVSPFPLVLVDTATSVIVRRKSDNFPVVFLSNSRKGTQAMNGTHPRYKQIKTLRPVAIVPAS